MPTDPDFLTAPMTVPGQLGLLDECHPRGLERLNVPLDEIHAESLIETRLIRSAFNQLQLNASRWVPGAR